MPKNSKSWRFSQDNFPHEAGVEEQLRFCVRYAVLAHSTYNTQPWMFEVEDKTISIYADRRYGLPVLDPDDRQLVMSCGGAIFNLRLALRAHGFQEYVQFLPNPADEDLMARIQVSKSDLSVGDDEKALFDAITTRHMNRSAYKKDAVEEEKLQALKEAAKREGAWLHVCEGDQKNIVAHFVAEGDQEQMARKWFRRELAGWMNERRYESGDGYPDYARSVKQLMASPIPRVIRRFESEPGVEVADDKIADGCPVIAILGSQKGGHVNHLYAGQAFMHVLLKAETLGLAVSTMNQPCEVPDLRLRLHDEIDHMHGRAQYILRIGYGERIVNASPRRPLDRFLSSVPENIKQTRSQEPSSKPSFLSRLKTLISP